MGEQIERRYAGDPATAQKAFEADMAKAAGQGWSVVGHRRDPDSLVVLYEQRVPAPAAAVAAQPAPWDTHLGQPLSVAGGAKGVRVSGYTKVQVSFGLAGLVLLVAGMLEALGAYNFTLGAVLLLGAAICAFVAKAASGAREIDAQEALIRRR